MATTEEELGADELKVSVGLGMLGETFEAVRRC